MRRIIYTISLLCILSFMSAIAQKNIGDWTSYLAYYTTTQITEGNNHVYAIADGSLYSYNKEDNSIKHYSKLTGLSDNDINFIRFNPDVNTLLITYTNGNIDLLNENGVYNLSYLFTNTNITDKTINNISLHKEFAYLSTNFGIIVINMDRREIKDTYKLNRSVYAVTIDENNIYAATSNGLYQASLNNNLLDYNVWHPYSIPVEYAADNIRQLAFFKDKLCFFINQSGNKGIYYLQSAGEVKSLLKNNSLTNMVIENNQLMAYTSSQLFIYNSLSTTDRNVVNVGTINNVSSLKDPNTLWIAAGTDGIKGIQKKNNSYETLLDKTNDDTQYPKRNYNYFMTTDNNKLLVIGGGRWTDRWGRAGTFMRYEEGKWFNLNETIINKAFRSFWDYTGVAVDPLSPNHYFISSYGEGVVELVDDAPVNLYDSKNSSLENITSIAGLDPNHYVRVGGITFDKQGNLWATNCEVPSVLSVLKRDGTWTSFNFSDFTNVPMVDKITITSDNRKWINVPYSRGAGIFIFDDKNTIDDKSDDQTHYIKLFNDVNGTIDVSGYFCITEDKNRQIWVGTNRGPIIVTNSTNMEQIRGTRIIREDADEPYYFLDGERINSIAVDGGNQKWIATHSSGLFLVSEDGMETIEHFTTDNSPLPSNQINSLAIDNETGEVFIGTEKGLVSYMGSATEGGEAYSDVYAYPNPVRPEHNDKVTIVGLMADSNVKITDIRGNIVYQAKSTGGTLIWNCRNNNGNRVATGIYLVFAATPEAEESVVTKIMVVK